MRTRCPVLLRGARAYFVMVCVVLMVLREPALWALAQPASGIPQPSKIPSDQLDSLVAPIALYPDPLLAQVLAASTYPLEVVQLQQWLEQNKELKDKTLADAVAKQPWDPSIQALAALPDVVKRLANDIQWTTDLGNAFLAQESDVMDAVQRMRKKAQEKGTLKSTEQQTVETKVVENKNVIIVQPSHPDVIYVPSYDPVVVYGPAIYPYPPIYYPPPGYYAAGMALSFGVGVMMGAFWSGGWGWGCGWSGNNVYINNNNNFIRNNNIRGGARNNIGNGNRLGAGAGNRWQHNPSHRGGAPYRDRATANRFGGTARGDSLNRRQASARQQLQGRGGLANSRASNASMGTRGSDGNFGNREAAEDRIGSRNLSRNGGGNRDAFGGGTRGYSGSNARASGSRGASSLGSRGGGGFSRGGGFRGGGRRR